MELRVGINSKVVEWLASMGYPVAGMPVQLLHGMLLREARQWQLSPERLERMILEGRGTPRIEGFVPALYEAQAATASHRASQSMRH